MHQERNDSNSILDLSAYDHHQDQVHNGNLTTPNYTFSTPYMCRHD